MDYIYVLCMIDSQITVFCQHQYEWQIELIYGEESNPFYNIEDVKNIIDELNQKICLESELATAEVCIICDDEPLYRQAVNELPAYLQKLQCSHFSVENWSELQPQIHLYCTNQPDIADIKSWREIFLPILFAIKGNIFAQFALGEMYFDGRDVAQDDKQAVYWYQQSADQGNTDAQCNLGWMYEV